MVEAPLAALEQAFLEAREWDGPLAERLLYVSKRVQEIIPEYGRQVDDFICRLESANVGGSAPQIGDRLPGFILPDEMGGLVSLDRLLEKAPVAVVFLRGHWCPYCRLNAHGLAGIEDDVAPVQIVAISAETQAFTRKLKQESGARFPFLSDIGNGYALSLNLAVWIDDALASLISELGSDIPLFQNHDGWIVPIPSVFVVAQNGLIVARHVDPDHRRRLEMKDFLGATETALPIPTASPGEG